MKYAQEITSTITRTHQLEGSRAPELTTITFHSYNIY